MVEHSPQILASEEKANTTTHDFILVSVLMHALKLINIFLSLFSVIFMCSASVPKAFTACVRLFHMPCWTGQLGRCTEWQKLQCCDSVGHY